MAIDSSKTSAFSTNCPGQPVRELGRSHEPAGPRCWNVLDPETQTSMQGLPCTCSAAASCPDRIAKGIEGSTG